MRGQRCVRAATTRALVALAVVAAVSGCGGAAPQRGDATQAGQPPASATVKGFNAATPIPDVRQVHAGTSARSALVLSRANAKSRRSTPVVIFLHAWGPTGTLLYKAWLRHLVGDGATVIFPLYQDRTSPPSRAVKDIQAGVRAALTRIRAAPASVIVAGHTTGAVLALDYAITATSAGLPPACAVYGIFPALKFGLHAGVPLSDPARLPGTTRLVLVAGSSDPVPNGKTLARAIIAQARQIPSARKGVLNSPGDDPDGPLRATRQARRVYWRPLDRMIRRCARRR